MCWSTNPPRTSSLWWFTETLKINCCLVHVLLCLLFPWSLWAFFFFSSWSSVTDLNSSCTKDKCQQFYQVYFTWHLKWFREFSVSSSMRLCHGDDCWLLDVMLDGEEQGVSVQFNVMTHCTPVDAHMLVKAWPTNVKSADFLLLFFPSCRGRTIRLDI